MGGGGGGGGEGVGVRLPCRYYSQLAAYAMLSRYQLKKHFDLVLRFPSLYFCSTNQNPCTVFSVFLVKIFIFGGLSVILVPSPAPMQIIVQKLLLEVNWERR